MSHHQKFFELFIKRSLKNSIRYLILLGVIGPFYVQDSILFTFTFIGLNFSLILNCCLLNARNQLKTNEETSDVVATPSNSKPLEDTVSQDVPLKTRDSQNYGLKSNLSLSPIECINTPKHLDLGDPTVMSDKDVLLLVINGRISQYNLEKILKNNERVVKIRKDFISRSSITKTFGKFENSALPMEGYDYPKVMSVCREN
ncbi:15002_t:CDS:1, partial [Gigaspora rosea]